MRNSLRELAAHAEEWAGIPIPIDGEELVIEPSYPFAKVFERKKSEPATNGVKIVNTWFSSRRGGDIVIFEDDGRRDWGLKPGIHHLGYDVQTLGCSWAWGIEQESNAIHLLGTLVRHHQFKTYMLTGMFLEKSARSGVTYLFRRLKPTVALKERDGQMIIMAALCMHPIGYYAGSWAGAMCPTDDVIAHLSLMRGDEHMFWKRSSQHPAYRPEAGL